MGRSKNGGLGFGISFGSQGGISQSLLDSKIDNLTKKAKREVCMIKWASKKDWFDAIKARKSGTATNKQIELLDKGHYRKGRKK